VDKYGRNPANGVDDDGNGYIDDYYGYDFANSVGDPSDDNTGTWHGTHCAGTIAGDGSFSTQTGVAPGAQIAAIKILNSSGSGLPANVVEAIEYALMMDIDVFSMSIGWETLPLHFPIIFAVYLKPCFPQAFR
jgi:subtilisin family serine protease